MWNIIQMSVIFLIYYIMGTGIGTHTAAYPTPRYFTVFTQKTNKLFCMWSDGLTLFSTKFFFKSGFKCGLVGNWQYSFRYQHIGLFSVASVIVKDSINVTHVSTVLTEVAPKDLPHLPYLACLYFCKLSYHRLNSSIQSPHHFHQNRCQTNQDFSCHSSSNLPESCHMLAATYLKHHTVIIIRAERKSTLVPEQSPSPMLNDNISLGNMMKTYVEYKLDSLFVNLFFINGQ